MTIVIIITTIIITIVAKLKAVKYCYKGLHLRYLWGSWLPQCFVAISCLQSALKRLLL